MWRLLVTCSLLLGSTSAIQTHNDVTNTSLVVAKPGVRQGKILFPAFAQLFPFSAAVFRFKQARCTGTNSLIGTCYLSRECTLEGGTAFGSCARRLGKCCVVSRNCGGSPSKSNHTYYRNPGFPDVYAGGAQCKISIAKMTDAICQIRLQFVRFTLAQPNTVGQCVSDFLTINNADTKMPRICGNNADQHIYVKFLDDGSPIELSIDTNVNVRFNRQWDILVTQHACNESVPLGCTQYFTGVTGTVTSFNYGTSRNEIVKGTDTRQLVDQQYTVCVRPEAGYCGIDWSQTDFFSFTVSGNTRQLDIDKKLGTVDAILKGDQCTGDYIMIPNALQDQKPADVDRFCGNALTARTRSMVTPMSLTVVTDGTEPANDIDNRGFQLSYRQVPCPQNI